LTVHPENSLYSPDDAADSSPYHGTDRAGTSVAFIDTVSNTAGYSLRVRSQRNRECSNKYACNQDLSFHQVIPLCDSGHDTLPGNNGDWAARFCFKRGLRGL
jgi:hypothetical protein